MPESHPIDRMDDVVHQRVRLGILATCASGEKVDFTFLKESLGLTDGNLGRHLAALEAADLVALQRRSDGGRVRTWVSLTRAGRRALRREVQALREIIEVIEPRPAGGRAGLVEG
jgi:DNA-binding MarR family transcriptional regulator